MITASLVTYKTPEPIVSRIRTMCAEAGVELYVVDNTINNVGFGAGHNKAIRWAMNQSAEYHFIINPDISFEPGTMQKIVAFMDENPHVGLVMPKTLNVDGSLQYNCKMCPTPLDLIGRRFLPRRIIKRRNDRFTLTWADYEQTMEVPYLCGCFMCFKITALRTVGLFDERFFMYPEDIDITRRMWTGGWHPTYFADASVIHAHAAASYKNFKMMVIHICNMIRYFNKWGWIFDTERTHINREFIERMAK